MTPNEHDNPETSEEFQATGLYRSSADYPQGTDRALDGTMPDVPAMEQLPDPDALPDPGYPVMPTSPREYASGIPPRPSFHPIQPEQPVQAAEPPKQVWSPDPYAAPRAPDDAPPLRGPSVPWSEVRAAADYEAAGEPLAAPPSLRERASDAARTAQTPPEGVAQQPTSEPFVSDHLLPGKPATPDGGWRRTVYRATGGLIHIGESPANGARRDLVRRGRVPE